MTEVCSFSTDVVQPLKTTVKLEVQRMLKSQTIDKMALQKHVRPIYCDV